MPASPVESGSPQAVSPMSSFVAEGEAEPDAPRFTVVVVRACIPGRFG